MDRTAFEVCWREYQLSTYHCTDRECPPTWGDIGKRAAFALWTASRLQALEEAAKEAVKDVLQWPHDDPVRVQAEDIAAALRAMKETP